MMYIAFLNWCIEGAMRSYWPPLNHPPESEDEAAYIAGLWVIVFQCAHQSHRIGLLCDANGAWGMSPWSTEQWEAAEAEELQERQLAMELV